MYILLISRGVPTKKDPQWGCFELDQAKALQQNGHKVVVMAVDSRLRLQNHKEKITHYNIDGIDCFNVSTITSYIIRLFGWKFRSSYYEGVYLRAYKHILKLQGKPDLIYSHYLDMSYYAAKLRKAHNIPVVAIEHWSKLNNPELPFYIKAMGEETYKNVDKLISVSSSLKTTIKHHFGADAIVIHNMIGNEFCNPISTFPISSKFKFVAVGSLIYRKGFELLPKAFAKLQLPKDKWELNIVGEGKERQSIQKLIDDAGLTNNINLLGKKNKSQIVDILRDSNVFILPSRNENFSVAVLEALSCGLPVISSICGGIRECIFDYNGLLFPVDDLDALTNAIKHMYDNYQSYDRALIVEDCIKRYSPNNIAKQLIECFESVLSKYKK